MSRRPRHIRAPHLAPTTEKQVVQLCVSRFLLAGWNAVRTEANNVGRGQRKGGGAMPGALPTGFPDYMFTKGLGRSGLGLVAYVEFKRPTGGKVSERQARCHADLAQNYQQQVHVVSSLEQAEALIARGQQLEAALKKAGLA